MPEIAATVELLAERVTVAQGALLLPVLFVVEEVFVWQPEP